MGTIFQLIGLLVVIFIVIGLLFDRGISKKKVEKLSRIIAEKAYFDGQKDALNDKIYIEKSEGSKEYDQWKPNMLPDIFEKKPKYNPKKDFNKQVEKMFNIKSEKNKENTKKEA